MNELTEITSQLIQHTFKSFGIAVTITNISCGSTVTLYEIEIPPSIKVSRIMGLSQNLKLSLRVPDVRIETTDHGTFAIEVPNAITTMVQLHELIQSQEFQQHSSNLAFALGTDISGKPVIADIATMPHLLIAGATGSGKSVCINALITSIITKASPEDVKLIMIDPKMVELSVYNGIPHLYTPVITDARRAIGALKWAVDEMERRYNLLASYGVRNIDGYNSRPDITEKMTRIVVIIDELADLMMVAKKDVETSICRIAQLARACGMHLVIATQRPSVNVITGVIKANMPSRIAFAVSSSVDSRTILDMGGAEKLLGKGDMLYFPQDARKPIRIQGSFISDSEVNDMVESFHID